MPIRSIEAWAAETRDEPTATFQGIGMNFEAITMRWRTLSGPGR